MLNLTPHSINFQNKAGEIVEIPASGTVARLPMKSVVLDSDLPFEVRTTEYGDVEGIPAVGEGPFIVSALVLGKLGIEYRGQAFAPDTGPTAVRENGLVKYVTGFITV